MVFLSPSSWPALHRLSRTSSPPPSTRFLADLPPRLIGDRGYDSDQLDETLLASYGIEMIAANRRGRTRTQDGRALRRARRRWKVERFFAWLHNVRRVVTRWERHVNNYLGMVQFACARRLGELLGLQWADVDLGKATIRVRQALQRVGQDVRLVEPKSERSRRVVRLPGLVIDSLKRHERRQRAEKVLAGSRWTQSGFVFTSSIGSPCDERNVRRDFHALLKRAALPRIRSHDLRHTCATLLLEQGVAERVVMETLGHSQISLTLDIYSGGT